ncbi:TPA: DUF1642 domain-containing protein [Streptococcus suis]
MKREQFQVPYGPGIFVHAVFADKAIELISQIHEPQTVVLPKEVASWLKYAKTTYCSLGRAIRLDEVDTANYACWSKDRIKLLGWMASKENQETFARAWLDGYEIERDKLYTVELSNGQPLVEVNNILYFSSDLAASNAHVSKDKLEAAGFGWVFDCSGVKVVEVE